MEKFEHKYLFAVNKIREAIRHLEIDDKLPGERVFAKDLDVSYMTARKAVEALVAEGVLYKVAKKGTYVADRRSETRYSKNIAYLLDSSIKDGLSSPYYSMIFDALEKEATKIGYALIYASNFSDSSALENMTKIDGAIISCFPRVEDIVHDLKKKLPIVCIDNSSIDKSIPSVTIDNHNAVVDSIDYLCTLGHKRIGFITGLDDSDVGNDRFSGYLKAIENHGIGVNMELVYKGDYSFDTGAKGADYLLSLDRQPTAIMCANDIMAIGAIKEISKKGLNVPGDISVMGFDDINVASQMTPALTTVAAPVKDIAQHSINMLNSMMNGLDLDTRQIALNAQLIHRNSCASPKESSIAGRKSPIKDRSQGTPG